jgi:tRNA-splicing ligase RtcB
LLVSLLVLKKISKNVFSLEKKNKMIVSPKVFVSDEFSNVLNTETGNSSLAQLENISTLPGLLKVVALPDIHPGYGAPIGTVTASSLNEGMIAFASTGFDINCGVHSLILPIKINEIKKVSESLANALFKRVPVGLGTKSELELTMNSFDELLEKGAEFVVKKGYGTKKDLLLTEDKGKVLGANPKNVSQKAKERGLDQIGTLGSGNHYLEIQEVSKVFDEKIAKKFGLKKTNAVVSIHCGSRALGHQVASDYLSLLEGIPKKYGFDIPSKELACAPFSSEEGQKYFSAIQCASNAAFANRLVIAEIARRVIAKELSISEKQIKTLYDVGHNTAKVEKHLIGNESKKKQKILVQRKGSTRGFGPNCSELPSKYSSTGQPIIVGGSMGTSSFILSGTKKAMSETIGSTIHGAGRKLSRTNANQNWSGENILEELKSKGITIKARSIKSLSEEAPSAYKEINSVVNIVHNLGISKKVVELKPIICIKG